jgi:hypothetical protein
VKIRELDQAFLGVLGIWVAQKSQSHAALICSFCISRAIKTHHALVDHNCTTFLGTIHKKSLQIWSPYNLYKNFSFATKLPSSHLKIIVSKKDNKIVISLCLEAADHCAISLLMLCINCKLKIAELHPVLKVDQDWKQILFKKAGGPWRCHKNCQFAKVILLQLSIWFGRRRVTRKKCNSESKNNYLESKIECRFFFNLSEFFKVKF